MIFAENPPRCASVCVQGEAWWWTCGVHWCAVWQGASTPTDRRPPPASPVCPSTTRCTGPTQVRSSAQHRPLLGKVACSSMGVEHWSRPPSRRPEREAIGPERFQGSPVDAQRSARQRVARSPLPRPAAAHHLPGTCWPSRTQWTQVHHGTLVCHHQKCCEMFSNSDI